MRSALHTSRVFSSERLICRARPALPVVSSSVTPCRAAHRMGAWPTPHHPHPNQTGAAARRSLVKVRLFDALKNLIPNNKPQPDEQRPAGSDANSEQEEEDNAGEDEGAEMRRLDTESGGLAEDQGTFGPLAVLLVGFLAEEVEGFRKFMLDMEADMVKIIPCAPAQMAGTLQAALESGFPQYQQPPLGTRRTVFLSGMVGAEVVEVIAAYKDAGLPPTVWAAAVPNNYNRLIQELVAEVHADNAVMVRRAQEAQARRDQEEEQQQ